VTRGLSYLHDNDVVHGDLKTVIGVSFSFIESFRLTYHPSQQNVLIDGKGSPRLYNFGLCSITKRMESINASTPNQGCTIRYCAPELLDAGNAVKDAKQKATNESDVYSLSMIIVEVCVSVEIRHVQVQIISPSSLRPGGCRFLTIRTTLSPSLS